MSSALDTAQKEFERWRLRARRLLAAIDQVDEERARLDVELEREEHQVAYYDNKTREMKREHGLPGISKQLSSLRKP